MPLRLRFLVLGGGLLLVVAAFLVFGFRKYDHYSVDLGDGGIGSGIGKSLFFKTPPLSRPHPSPPDQDHRTCTPPAQPQTDNNDTWEFIASRDGDNYGLSDEQCQIAFPKLFVEIDKSVALRAGANKPITWKELNSRKVGDGLVRAIVDRGELYIVDFGDMPYTFTRAKATLHSLHRALIAVPNRHELPSVEFIFSTEDFVVDTDKGPIWAYSKRDEDDAVWLMPDFGFWSWPEVKVGPYRDIRRRIAAVDDGLAFRDKKKQLLWRGSLATAPELRGNLLANTRGKPWASIRVLDWSQSDDNDKSNVLPMEEHCRYMFLAHTEGRSFSGRGKYLQNCRSVVIAHQLVWREAHHAALVSSGPDANYVEVARDFSDLEEKIEYLLDHPFEAERIANNSVATFRDRYLTPAAEACYWRYLIRQYASVCAFEPSLYETDFWGRQTMRAVPYESWLLMESS
ncbi:DUF821 domain protein [Rasamsonia emersonii CBS 393.64]|uniref:DUF821 domain protein n=1 Tax=Rasamsonia emersonii (strain ATCC 16479 / CBS 393.64 / IMI 116815) TaxID=1408163 RepID=A0A0F4YPH7_RASE3|nr:DUF821 domain protein [Rasamsonia emersonii CBS 393.64]KKA20139.1 DUF821 domain protein [Rasamsonia emersonii CBS 393.64]